MNNTENNDLTNQNVDNMAPETIPTEPINQPLSIEPVTPISESTASDDEELLKAFIGANYEKLTTKKFNLAGFFFEAFYMFYRKMFGWGLLVILIITAVSTYLTNANNFLSSPLVILIFMLVVGTIVGLTVNKIYVQHAKKKIDKIKAANPQMSTDDLKVICAKKGGTSIGLIFLGIIIMIAFAFLLATLLAAIGLGTIMNNIGGEIIDDDFGDYSENAKKGIYNGMLYYDNEIKIADEFTITVPTKFEDDAFDESAYTYKYEAEEGIFNECKINLAAIKEYNDAQVLVNGIATYKKDDNPTTVTKNTINNIDWYWFSLIDSFGKTYYYGTTKNNKVYLLEYDINEDAEEDCESYLSQIVNSIQSK